MRAGAGRPLSSVCAILRAPARTGSKHLADQ